MQCVIKSLSTADSITQYVYVNILFQVSDLKLLKELHKAITYQTIKKEMAKNGPKIRAQSFRKCCS